MSTAPPDPHAPLDRFADGELSPGEAEAFRGHLAGCEACQAKLHERVQLAGLAQGALGQGAAVVSLARWRTRAAAAVGVALAAGLAVAIAGRLPGGEPDPSLWLADRPSRPFEARLATPAADHHRPYEVARGAEAPPAPPLPALAKLEAKERWVAIADAYLARGAAEAARPYLDRAGSSPEALASRAAMDLVLGQPVEALHHANQALAKRPGFRPAAWNLGLALRALGLPLAAAQQLEKVAAEGEPGWSAEAKQLAAQLRADVERRHGHWGDAAVACGKAARGLAPFPADLQGVPLAFLRECLDESLAGAGTAEALERLLPAAQALDARLGGDGARRAVQRALAQPLQERERVVRELQGFMAAAPAGMRGEDLIPLAERARKAGQRDLELRALLLAPADRVPQERLQALAAATADPWYAAFAEERVAAASPAAGRALLESREQACAGIDRYELRCLAAERALLRLYQLPADRAAALSLGARALDRARREGDVAAEVGLLPVLAKAAGEADPDLSAAYFAEHTLRTKLTP